MSSKELYDFNEEYSDHEYELLEKMSPEQEKKARDIFKQLKTNPLAKSSGAGALSPEAAEQLGDKAKSLRKKKLAMVGLPSFKSEEIEFPSFIQRIREGKERGMSSKDTYNILKNHKYTKQELWDMQRKATERGDHGVAHGIYSRWKEMKNEEYISEREMTASEKRKESRLKKKFDDSEMKQNMIDQYGKEKGMEVYFAKIRKMAMGEEYIEEKARGTRPKRTVHAYDVDETLFGHGKKGKPNVQVHVKDESGKRVQSLSNQEFNTHKLKPGHKYDFGEFQSAKKFRETSSPNKKVIKDIKRKQAFGDCSF